MKITTLMTIHRMLENGATIDQTASATGATAAEVRAISNSRNQLEAPDDDLRLERAAWNRERAAAARAAL
jgi:hypothetical protein